VAANGRHYRIHQGLDLETVLVHDSQSGELKRLKIGDLTPVAPRLQYLHQRAKSTWWAFPMRHGRPPKSASLPSVLCCQFQKSIRLYKSGCD
jgi:hypothetical protein